MKQTGDMRQTVGIRQKRNERQTGDIILIGDMRQRQTVGIRQFRR